jgi:hypothetical protein
MQEVLKELELVRVEVREVNNWAPDALRETLNSIRKTLPTTAEFLAFLAQTHRIS